MRLVSAVRLIAGLVLAVALPLLAEETPANEGLKNNQQAEELFRAIRANRTDEIKRLATVAANSRDKLQSTPLHYAAMYGNVDALKALLEAGADVNATDNRGATPLLYAAYNFDKTKLLVDHGATVNAASRMGQTPLDIAVVVHGNAATVRYLLDHGAKVDPQSNVLIDAAGRGDFETIKLLLSHGADVKHVDELGDTALFAAMGGDPVEQCREKADLLLPGSNVNALNTNAGRVKNGPIALTHMSALMLAVQGCDASVTAKLVKAGANVNERDVRQMTPLMMSVASDSAKPDAARVLLAAGADINAKDLNGETALDWALKYRNPAIVKVLADAGVPHGDSEGAPVRPAAYRPTPEQSLQRSAALLSKTIEQFWPAGGGCVACHAQPLSGHAYVAMKEAGLNPPESLKRMFTEGMISMRPRALNTAAMLQPNGGDYDGPLTQFSAMVDLNTPASDITDAMVHYLATRQEPSGEWALAGGDRPPLQASSISRTAAAIRALKTYQWPARQDEFNERIARANHWLLEAKPETTYEMADRLLGLYYADAPEAELQSAGRELLKARKADGGWAQTRFLSSDAYATSRVLDALRATGQMTATDPIYRAGVYYLVNTQMPDGSWYVRSRAMKLQPYFQSGFPYNHDQWISTAATAWAIAAIAPRATATEAAARF